MQSLPVEVASPITDKLSAELDSKWLEKPHIYSAEDYKKAKSVYLENRSSRGELSAVDLYVCNDMRALYPIPLHSMIASVGFSSTSVPLMGKPVKSAAE